MGGRRARVRHRAGLVEIHRRAIKPGSFATLPSSLSASRMTFEEARGLGKVDDQGVDAQSGAEGKVREGEERGN